MAREDEINGIAYNIWQEEGCCDGREMEHWLRAERIWEESQGEKQPVARRTKAATPRTTKAAATRSTKAKTRTKADKSS